MTSTTTVPRSGTSYQSFLSDEVVKSRYLDDPTVIHRCVCSHVKRLVPGEERGVVYTISILKRSKMRVDTYVVPECLITGQLCLR